MNGLPKHISGELVFTALTEHPAGLNKPQLADVTRLSLNQVGVGITWVRDFAATEHNSPVTWTRDHGYQLSPGTDICEAFECARFRAQMNSLLRLAALRCSVE